MEQMIAVAKPPEWVEHKSKGRDRQWTDGRHGFSIVYDPDDEADARYLATWGEGPEDCFATLADAQQWCQYTINEWVRDNVVLTPNAKSEPTSAALSREVGSTDGLDAGD